MRNSIIRQYMLPHMSSFIFLAFSAGLLSSCVHPQDTEAPTGEISSPKTDSVSPILPWIHNDLDTGKNLARAQRKPLFIYYWCDACQACRLMKKYVFSDPRMGKYSTQFVWLSINLDEYYNEDDDDLCRINTLPTIMVLDLNNLDRIAHKEGAANFQQLSLLLETARYSFNSAASL